MPIPSISSLHKIRKALLPLFIKHRPTATSSSPSFSLTENLPTAAAAAAAPKLDFGDTERLYAAVETGELLRSLATLYPMAAAPAVDMAMAVMRSKAVEENWAARTAVMGAVRKTIYRQFCAGEAAEEAAETLRRLWKGGMRGILDYGLEDASGGAACDRNLAGFLSTVEMTETLPPDSVSFACVKITAICPTSLLERVSQLLLWQQKHPSFPLPWLKPSLQILPTNSTHTPTSPPPPPLTQPEQLQLQLSHHRLAALCRRCSASNLPLLVDAEYSSVQPAIDHMLYAAVLDFNRHERPVIYGTVQAYLKDAEERLVMAVEGAEKAGVSVGFKLVRGAYLSREIALASKMGVASPIHESVERTHACFDACAAFVLEKIAQGAACSVVLATHNIDSGKLAAEKAEELGIRKGEQKLQFAQLMGMADGLSLALKNAGFQVSKYLPFGPVEQIMPYLVRRAEENRGVLSSSAIDRELLSKELKRRLRVQVFGR